MKWVRPILALEGMTAVTIGFFIGKIDAVAFFGLVSAIVVWWFKERDKEKEKEGKP